MLTPTIGGGLPLVKESPLSFGQQTDLQLNMHQKTGASHLAMILRDGMMANALTFSHTFVRITKLAYL
jgi:hypothetical protein